MRKDGSTEGVRLGAIGISGTALGALIIVRVALGGMIGLLKTPTDSKVS